ncbi:MAG: DUF3160 domain-containing protein, partial [Asgard group archaeon]|nr:DUF3160 domain-containing protein [Asgard group archaeon]
NLMRNLFTTLRDLSIKELKNNRLTDSEMNFIIQFGDQLADIYDYYLEDMKITKERSAIIADVAGATTSMGSFVLEVAVGNPYIIYVVVPDNRGNLKLTYGATFSYYEFEQPISEILNDESWQEMLDTNPPDLPEWISINLPLVQNTASTLLIIINRRRIYLFI